MEKEKLKKWQIVLVILIVIEIIFWAKTRSIFGVIHTDGPYYGRVIDAKTGKSIEGAAVAGLWNIEHFAFIHTVFSFGNAVEATTDANGKYFLSRIWVFSAWPFSWLNKPEINVFKRGYDTHPPEIYHYWTNEDVKRRGISKSDYVSAYFVQCKPNQECLIKLNATETDEERLNALNGISKGKILHKEDLQKIRHYLSEANKDLAMYGLDQREID